MMDGYQKDRDSFSVDNASDMQQQKQHGLPEGGEVHQTNKRLGTRLASIREANKIVKENRTDRMEDYLEVVYELVLQKGYATTIDISVYLNVSSPSFTCIMKGLHKRYERYRGVSLTEKGREVAKAIHKRHSLLFEFFKMIGVNRDLARGCRGDRTSFT